MGRESTRNRGHEDRLDARRRGRGRGPASAPSPAQRDRGRELLKVELRDVRAQRARFRIVEECEIEGQSHWAGRLAGALKWTAAPWSVAPSVRASQSSSSVKATWASSTVSPNRVGVSG